MKYYNTIDLDKIDSETLKKILRKIIHCDNLKGNIEVRNTQKGFHLLFTCKIKCDNCRFVFDDAKRFEMDFHKPEHKKNILFEPFSIHTVRRLKP